MSSLARSLERLLDSSAVAPAPAPPRPLLPLAETRRQWLPVSAHIRQRYLVTYRAPAARLRALLPAPLTVDAYEGYGFVSVCALDMTDMGIVGLPSWLRFDNRELLYRVGVRVRGQPSFFTLRSDVSSGALALLGRFSCYRLRRAQVTAQRADGRLRLTCRSADGRADADFEAATTPAADVTSARDSIFRDAERAAAFLLGMRFSTDVAPDGRVLVQDIDHDPWGARFVEPTRCELPFMDHLGLLIGAPLSYDNTLVMANLRQTWRAARWI